MEKYLTKQQVKTILQNAPTGSDNGLIIDGLVNKGYTLEGFNDQEQVAQEQKIQQEGVRANEFLAKSPLQQVFSKETAKELLPQTGKIAKDILIDTPIKAIKSTITAPATIATGGEYTAPGTYQAEAKQTASDVIEGKKPLISSLTPFLTVPLDVTGTVGLGIGTSNLAKAGYRKAAPIVSEQLAKRQASKLAKEVANADKIVGQIIQGTPEDIASAKKALSSIDVQGIKTYDDLNAVLNTKIKTISNKLDDTLEQSPIYNQPLRIGDMDKTITVNGATVRTNYVDDALNQLEDFYTKTNNIERKTAIQQLRQKGDTEGLTVKEVNDIAKLHGQDLSGFNANGELASGLSKQAAENTRKGIKSTAREIYGGDAYAQADAELSNLIRTRDLIKDMVDEVNKLQQKIQERGLGEKAGRLVFEVGNLFTGGGLKGFIGGAIPKGRGYKTLNALDLESLLSKNLKQLQKANTQKTEKGLINSLNSILEEYKKLPNKQGGFIKLPNQSSKPARSILNDQPTTNINSNISNISKSYPKTDIKSIAYKGESDLTTKILKDLEGKTTVSKQYILDATNRGELKQVERDLIRNVLETEKDVVNVADFAKKVKSELLPLSVKDSDLYRASKKSGGYSGSEIAEEGYFTPKYENITLPDEVRGKVKTYKENIYESPIQTSAGNTHFHYTSDKYFGHTRIEDMADNKTRRVIEVQSDLYQKGNLQNEPFSLKEQLNKNLTLKEKEFLTYIANKDTTNPQSFFEAVPKDLFSRDKLRVGLSDADLYQYAKDGFTDPKKQLSKLQQYNDPTAHFRMIREEIKKAAEDGKTKLQFPTGETAMKIEGLGQGENRWFDVNYGTRVNANDMKVGDEITHTNQFETNDVGSHWIITDVLGDGKFKAIPKSNITSNTLENLKKTGKLEGEGFTEGAVEQFDISGKVDTNNPIYKFYEKDVQKYLNKFGGKKVVDNKGVSWIEIPITKEQGKAPVEAFGKVQLGVVGTGALIGAGAVGVSKLKTNKK